MVRPGIAATVAWGLDGMQMPFLVSKVHAGQVVWDVGANCGLLSMLFARLIGDKGHVHAFEPISDNVELARRNLALNGVTNVTLHELALAREPGDRALLFDPARHTMGVLANVSVKMNDWSETVPVRCETIDRLIEAGVPEPDVIKIDVEGAGAEVLVGADKLLRRRKPAIYLELHASSRESPEWRVVEDLKQRWNYCVEDVCGTLNDGPGGEWSGAVWCQ